MITKRKTFTLTMRSVRCLLTVVLLLLFSLPALGQNVTLTYQGNLADANGDPVNADVPMSFRLYESANGGDVLWTEFFNEVSVMDGAFVVELGSTEPLPDALANFGSLFLGISIDGGAELAPRMPVGSALQAQWAAQTGNLEGRDIDPNSVSINGNPVIDSDGFWVGELGGLAGPEGPEGPAGPEGVAGLGLQTVEINDQGELVMTYTDNSVSNLGVVIGNEGAPGVAGPQGEAGPQGPQGIQGQPGPQGAQGAIGPQGVQGEVGPQGPQGLLGEVGAQGPQGLQGEVGAQGPQGLQGEVGAQGPQGLQGEVGPQGPQGVQGEVGPQGPQGVQGEVGAQGLQGEVGPQGLQGETGPQGLTGPAGPQGVQGEVGPQGEQGPAGAEANTITSAEVDANGNLVFEMGNGESLDAGNVLVQAACSIQQKFINGVLVPGNIMVTCGDQPSIELTTVQCGNGALDPGEVCDDGNRTNHDGCDNRCMNECEDLKFTGANCDVCVDDTFTGPNCDECTDPKYTGETCEECADDKFTGVNCDECADPRFGGANCDECVGFGVGENCEPAPCIGDGGCPELDFVNIVGDVYPMGAVWKTNEKPIHDVNVDNFRMMRKEVTVGQYRACVEAGACAEPRCLLDNQVEGVGVCNYLEGREDHPINYINWFDAYAFATWVGATLPSEAQWEFAARSRGIDQFYPWGVSNPTCLHANLDGCDGIGTTVGCAHPNGNSVQGICDLGGNVAEWVMDNYHDTYDGAPVDGSAWCTRSRCILGDDFRVVRGGGWNSGSGSARNTNRGFLGPYAVTHSLGFRVIVHQ